MKLIPLCSLTASCLTMIIFSGCATKMQSRFLVFSSSKNAWQEGLVYELPSSYLDASLQFSIYKLSAGQNETAKVVYGALPDSSQWKVTPRAVANSQLRFAIDPEDLRKAGVSQEFASNKIELNDAGYLENVEFQAADKSGQTALNLLKTAGNVASLANGGPALFAAEAKMALLGEPKPEIKRIGSVVLRYTMRVEDLMKKQDERKDITRDLLSSPEIQVLNSGGENINLSNFSPEINSVTTSLISNCNKFVGVKDVRDVAIKMALQDSSADEKDLRKVTGPLSLDGIITRYKGTAEIQMESGKQLLFKGEARVFEAGGVSRIKVNGRKLTDSKARIQFAEGSVKSVQFGGGSTAEGASALALSVTKTVSDGIAAYETAVDAKASTKAKEIEARATLQKAVIDAKAKVATANISLESAKVEAKAAAVALKVEEAKNPRDETLYKAAVKRDSEARTAEIGAEAAVKKAEVELSSAEARAAIGV